MSELHWIHKPYQKSVFFLMLFGAVGVTIAVCVFVYVLVIQTQLAKTKEELLGIATKSASLIPVSSHERIQTAEDVNSETYDILKLYLQSVMSANPQIDDIYTLRPTSNSSIYSFVVSGAESEDKNGDGVLEDSELGAVFGEQYNISQDPDIALGLSGPVVNNEVTYDKWGSWISAYAPLRDSNRDAVAVLGVDYNAELLAENRHALLGKMAVYGALLLVIISVVAYVISLRLAKPIKILAEAIDRVLHGDHTFHLPEKGRTDERVFAEIFNHLVDAFVRGEKHKKQDS